MVYIVDDGKKLVHVASTVTPEPELTDKYEARYIRFKKIYSAVKELFPAIEYRV